MNDYQASKCRQIHAIERLLRLMGQRRAKERTHDCAITLSEDPPEGEATLALTEARVRQLAATLAGDGGDATSQGEGTTDSQESNGKGNDRYVQFAFMKKSFYLDLPNLTLSAHEASILLHERHGFFFLRDRRWLWMNHNEWLSTVRQFNPLQKEYLNGDEHAAAEDAAYVLFTLWKFPPDWQFFFRALRFNGRTLRSWEGTGPVV